jgi:hypothetical protein
VRKRKKMGKRTNGENVGVEKYDLGVLSKTKYVQFCKDSVQIETA